VRGIPPSIIVYNALATALLTVGVLASLYAGYLNPALRVTANSLSPVVNGLSTILLFVFIDPYLSILTDDVVLGKTTEAQFRRCVVLFVASRLAGTLLAQVIFVPAANIIVRAAKLL
jgi:Alternate to MurJ